MIPLAFSKAGVIKLFLKSVNFLFPTQPGKTINKGTFLSEEEAVMLRSYFPSYFLWNSAIL
ncbi:hypothetical protein [Aquimarina hainanensis]|uniref:hypothetical protein n=1 Tax=Aquimarina hainanensis TaxID=1578017 RepID=UPI00361BC5D2